MDEGPTDRDQLLIAEDRIKERNVHEVRHQTVGRKGIVGDDDVAGLQVLPADGVQRRLQGEPTKTLTPDNMG